LLEQQQCIPGQETNELQVINAVDAPEHCLPPYIGTVLSQNLDLSFVPFAHDAEHIDHPDQLFQPPSTVLCGKNKMLRYRTSTTMKK